MNTCTQTNPRPAHHDPADYEHPYAAQDHKPRTDGQPADCKTMYCPCCGYTWEEPNDGA